MESNNNNSRAILRKVLHEAVTNVDGLSVVAMGYSRFVNEYAELLQKDEPITEAQEKKYQDRIKYMTDSIVYQVMAKYGYTTDHTCPYLKWVKEKSPACVAAQTGHGQKENNSLE